MDTVTRAESFLESLSLTEQQIKEVCSVLPDSVKDSSETRIVESLVETQLEGSNTVTTMNAPRFNKFLRQLLTHYCDLDTTKESKHALCEKAVQWARDRKSVNLRHELELTLMSLYYSTYHYKQAETVASALYSETKKLQDKEKTVKACLCLSQVYHAMGNISKARANITTAKTEALKIYTPPDMQGELDLQSGIMQVAEGKDMETAYSYFKEAATGFTSRKQRARALKYMLLSKIMVNRAEDGEKAVRSQSHIEDIDEGVEAMLAIASAANRSSLAEFRKTREQYEEHLVGDMVVASVLDDLYTTMMEKNLLNIVLPYERLQIDHIAGRINLPREEIERRISQMILDKRINAQLDHRDDCLYVYASEDSDVVYQKGIDILSQLDKTVSHLNRKVKKLL
ncbi:26S proteasome non-ATPase regulatory subunit 11-like [Homarus americanus]|uniref:26S proteasome non-ATPase regulatory subunit 11-like n=1 Tax=Homarus americanus TaxID=6706 RepID=UPI001C456255|nr:26S proteasome non-ATPase regulatory subunit 11-like [Homarus americanus]